MASAPRDRAWMLSIALVFVAAGELIAHAAIQRAVVPIDDWKAAAEFVRAEFRAGDRLVAAPAWADPVLREVAGDLITVASAAPSDNSGTARLWELSIRGASSNARPSSPPKLERAAGRVTIRRWAIGGAEPLFDFVSEVEQARATVGDGAGAVSCKWQRLPRGGGGLGTGALAPSSRFVCDRRRAWLWVGETVTTDLHLQPRRCIWQHPDGRRPVRVSFSSVPLGTKAVFHAGIHYNNERERAYAPVTFRVVADDKEIGRFVHNDGDGWARYEIPTSAITAPADVTFETRTPDAFARTFCWSGYTVGGP